MDNDAISIKFLRKIRRSRYELVVSGTGLKPFHERRGEVVGLKCVMADSSATSGEFLL